MKNLTKRFKGFLKRRTKFQIRLMVKLIFFIPLVVFGIYNYGWKGLLTVIAGWCVGEVICRRFKLG